MANKLIISGGHPLKGEVTIQGSKNAAQKILPATIVFPGEYIVKNIPRIRDSAYMVEILEFLGAKTEFLDMHTIKINSEQMDTKEIPPNVTEKSTGTFLFAGALLSRFGEVKIWHPGGDKIGRRRVTWHLDAFRELGADVVDEQNYYEIRAKNLVGSRYKFSQRTVNGTVNAVLASVRAGGVTVIDNAALEPDIDDFIEFMNRAGAKIKISGREQLMVDGTQEGVGRADVAISPDRNDAATFVMIGALCQGPVTLIGIREKDLLPLLDVLQECGIKIETHIHAGLQSLTIQSTKISPCDLHISSKPYPGFSTDWGPMMQVFMTQIQGTSTFHETVFSQRFAHIDQLIKMGAKIEFYNPPYDPKIYNFPVETSDKLFHAVRIKGFTPLDGASVVANDIRAGAALVIAGLVAKGSTEVQPAYQVERGYERFDERLKHLGASIANG